MTMDMNHETILGLGFGEEKQIGRWRNDKLEEYYLVYSFSSENLANCRIVVYEVNRECMPRVLVQQLNTGREVQ